MTKAQKNILEQNVIIFELLFRIHQQNKSTDFFNDEIGEMVLIALAANQALKNRVERETIISTTMDHLPTSKN
jgi:hypothetical protein